MLRRTITAVVGLAMISASLITPTIAKAQTSGAAGLTIVPPSFELYANPGEKISEKIKVRNNSDSANTFQVIVEDFKAVGEDGSVDLVDDQSNTTYSLAKWVFPEPKQFTLAGKEEKEIPFSINVPKDAEPGGHYASVLINIGGGKLEGGGATVSSRVGSLILLRVSGNVKEAANVESFKTNQAYYEKTPVTFELRMKDTGNNHINPKGTIVITNIFGKKVSEVPLKGLNVLPGAIRKMDTTWNASGFLASRYTATLVATYGSQNLPISATTSFIVFPKYFAITLLVVLLLLIFLIVGRKKVKQLIHNLSK